MVKPGDVVASGQILINGYREEKGFAAFIGAEGEIFARTKRKIAVKMDPNFQSAVLTGAKEEKFSLLIGKKRINFYKGSGICDTSCVKMYWKYVLTLPGGYRLPVALVREQCISRKLTESIYDEVSMTSLLARTGRQWVKSQMIAGSILDAEEEFDENASRILYGTYTCQEMIGRGKAEEIGVHHGKTD